ncbi:MAG: hypothetical protein KDJ47_02615 [Hyphomicrobiaceae bacterium]|nr:hypothetical protein [Hyphomicrobiaceae bacterium]
MNRHMQPEQGRNDPVRFEGINPIGQALMQVADRIDQVLEEERAILAGSAPGSIDITAAHKSHLLVELMRLSRHLDAHSLDESVRRRLAVLKSALAGNAKLLRRHIEAVREISAIIVAAISASGDDGTYTGNLQRSGGRV